MWPHIVFYNKINECWHVMGGEMKRILFCLIVGGESRCELLYEMSAMSL